MPAAWPRPPDPALVVEQTVSTQPRALDLALVEGEGPESLVAVAREGRLARQAKGAAVRVELTMVDEAVLALVGRAIQRHRDVTIVYPAPAGEVSVLLAGEILVRRFATTGDASASVGIVIGDTTQATDTWGELAISSAGAREAISGVFPALRALPDGRSPVRRAPFRGVIIGRRHDSWPVDVVVIDHLSGPVGGTEPSVPTVRVFADPLDPELDRLAADGGLVWGWTESDLALLVGPGHGRRAGSVPFSVASERLETMAAGVKITIHVVHHPEAERIVKRLRDDLRTLADFGGSEPPTAVLRGIRVAWHHVRTLTSLPVRPSAFDRFAGLPPIAARATRTFEPEIAAWAAALTGDLREVAEIVASDLGELRTLLEEADPFRRELTEAVSDGSEGLVVVPTQTAARAFVEAMGGDPKGNQVGGARIATMRRLHRQGTCPRAVVVGAPARWDWHRLDSGLSPDVHVLVLGDLDAFLGRRTLEALHAARTRWADRESRERTWRELLGTPPPPAPESTVVPTEVRVIDAREAVPAIDPFEALEPLLASVPLAIGDEGVEDVVAREAAEGGWQGAVDAVRVETDAGTILLPRDRLVDVRQGEAIVERRAGSLEPGMLLLVDRRGNRVGLVDAVADRLQRRRPDLLAADLLIRDLRSRVQHAFAASGMTRAELFERMQWLGFEKSYHAVRGYVDDEGPLAPQHFDDLRRLHDALGLEMGGTKLREVFAGVQRWRGFKRAAGRALVAASRGSLMASEDTRIDADTGLSVADLRELVLEAKVLEVRECPEPVPLAEVGYIQPLASAGSVSGAPPATGGVGLSGSLAD